MVIMSVIIFLFAIYNMYYSFKNVKNTVDFIEKAQEDFIIEFPPNMYIQTLADILMIIFIIMYWNTL